MPRDRDAFGDIAVSDISAMVADLITAGCAPEVAAQVVARAFIAGVSSADVRGQSADISAERRREKDRLRKQEQRESLRKSADVCGNPQMSENASLSKKEKKEEIEPERGATVRPVRGHRLPDDWHPVPPDWAVAIELVGEPRSRSELEKFKDHWKQQPGSRGVKLDWSAAWRNWIRRSAEYGARNVNGNSNSRINSASGPAPANDPIVAAMARAVERRREARAAANGGGLPGYPDPAAGASADLGTAAGDRATLGQLAFLPRSNTSQER